MPEKNRMLLLPTDMPTVPNPAQKLFTAHCEPAGFEYPKRVIATPEAYSVMDRYIPLDIPDWWRSANKPPRFATRGCYFGKLNTFFEDKFPMNTISPLHRPAHETAHALLKHLDPKYRRFSMYFIEGSAEWLACELLRRGKKVSDTVHQEVLDTKYRKIELAEKNGIYTNDVDDELRRYVHGHQAVFDVMTGLFAPNEPLLPQYQFVVNNYDPSIVGSNVDRESYIEYYQMVLQLKQEKAVAA